MSQKPRYTVDENKLKVLLDEKFRDQNFVNYLINKYAGTKLYDGTVITKEFILNPNNRFEAVHEMVKYYDLPLRLLVGNW